MDASDVMKECVEVRTLVYRFILSNLGESKDANLLCESVAIMAYPFICAPKVSAAILDFLNTKTEFFDAMHERKRQLVKGDHKVARFIEDIVRDLVTLPSYHETKDIKLRAIEQAMCEDLEIDVQTFRGQAEEARQPQSGA